MEVKDYIKIYDDFLPLTLISTIMKWSNKTGFKEGKILGNDGVDQLDKNTRNTEIIFLNRGSTSLTNVHYAALLGKGFINALKQYSEDYNIKDFGVTGVNDIQILKYEVGGFYTWHIDHAGQIIPRSISMILFLNNDYKGGQLCFRDLNGENEISIDPKPGRLVIWPSNFLYPHTVKPVEEGTRYTVVAWAV